MYIKSGQLAIFVVINEVCVCACGYVSGHQKQTSGLSLLRMLYTLHVLFLFDFVLGTLYLKPTIQ